MKGTAAFGSDEDGAGVAVSPRPRGDHGEVRRGVLGAMVVTPSPRASGDGRGVRPEVLGRRRASEVLSPPRFGRDKTRQGCGCGARWGGE